MTILVARGEFENFLRFFHSEVAGGVENPEQRDAEIACAAGASALQALENCGEILLAIQADADRDVNFRVEHSSLLSVAASGDR